MTVSEVLLAAGQNGVTAVTGADVTVGMGGVIAGGGHGPVTNLFGMVADNVIEMEVVTPAGDLKTINTQSEPDLFWAMRGVCCIIRVSAQTTDSIRAAAPHLVS